ncbi:MAG: ABC transporter ATP-binding protein [Gemmatimonadetes bacterium]|nr:ABC transporter ATP-binding protein [Gemmatimonadota bacterium]MBI3566584.1 ABC transporter ATP-binding protein [Gemmatimonadota bacterium]
MIETRQLRKVYAAPAARRGAGAHGTSPRSTLPVSAPAAARNPRASGSIAALDGLDLQVREGEFFGLLGPNGAGKTTTIGILTTRVRATSGEAFVAGLDVAAQDVAVRRRIGVVPQRPNPDRGLNVIENLAFHGAYFGLGQAEAERRGMALLEKFEIGDKATSKVDELSGGQQQRLMIARALLHEPRVIFLDEPTVGLDPQARLALWDVLRALHREGRTIVMTTHYMQEADELCDRLAIVDRGKLLACDTPAALRAQAPGATLIDLAVDGDAAAAAERCRLVDGVSRVDATGPDLRAHSERGGEAIPALIRAVEDAGARVQNINLSKPSLETLFISLTGRKLD